MEINITLIIQMLVFISFVAFTMKFVWPPLSKALEARQDKIADGLAAAEKGQKELELAQHRIKMELKQARVQASDILEKASHRATQLIEEARDEAREVAASQLKSAQQQLQQEINHAKEALRQQVVELAVAAAEKILGNEINKPVNDALLNNLIKEI